MSSKPADMKLYNKIKKSIRDRYITNGTNKRWNAHLSQRLVKEYKKAGGKYTGKKSSASPLKKWQSEKWIYVPDGPMNAKTRGPRYLPESIVKKLTPAQRRLTNRNKRQCTKLRCSWEPFIKKLYEKMSK